MRSFPASGGAVVEILDEDYWTVPFRKAGKNSRRSCDFTSLPDSVRPCWRRILEASYRTDSLAQAQGIWFAARWFTRFQIEHDALTTAWDSLSQADWGVFTQWLETQQGDHGRPLAHDSRRCIVVWLKASAQHGQILELPGITTLTEERLRIASAQAFRNGDAVVRARIALRALTTQQYSDLLSLLVDEWNSAVDPADPHHNRVDLPSLVACWLAFCDAVRPEEINSLEVSDVHIDLARGRHQLHLHAPNKDEGAVPIDETSRTLLEALIREGNQSRKALGTDRLFVSTKGRAAVLTTQDLSTRLRQMVRRRGCSSLPADLKLADGRKTMATLITSQSSNREHVRQVLRHQWASTTETYYRAHQKLVVAGRIANALRPEVLRLSIACQRPIRDLEERSGLQELLERNPENSQLLWGSCGRDIQRQGSCRLPQHCFECPLFVPMTSKRHNFVNERDEYIRMAEEADTLRDRENRLYHAHKAEAYISLIDRRLARDRGEGTNDQEGGKAWKRRPRRARATLPGRPLA